MFPTSSLTSLGAIVMPDDCVSVSISIKDNFWRPVGFGMLISFCDIASRKAMALSRGESKEEAIL